jgi:hypothetical protein
MPVKINRLRPQCFTCARTGHDDDVVQCFLQYTLAKKVLPCLREARKEQPANERINKSCRWWL